MKHSQVYDYLDDIAVYAKNSRSLTLMYEVYGAAKMACNLHAISFDEFMILNTALVRTGINDPSSYDY